MKDIKESLILKIFCYTLVPILILVIIINVASIMIAVDYEEEGMNVNYFKSQAFSREYINTIYNIQNRLIQKGYYYNNTNEQVIIEEKNETQIAKEYETDEFILSSETEEVDYDELKSYIYKSDKYEILIIKPDGKAYTNVKKTLETDTVEKLKNYISSKSYRWIYNDKGEILTDIERLEYKKIAYDLRLTDIQENNIEIYMCLKDENNVQIVQEKLLYETVSKTYQNAPFIITISSVILLVCSGYILVSIGHKKEHEGIYLSNLDRIPLEILITVSTTILSIEIMMINVLVYDMMPKMFNFGISLIALMVILIYITSVISGITIIRRIKAKVFFKNTICYKMLKWIKATIKSLMSELFYNKNVTIKLVIIFAGFVIISTALSLLALESFIMAIILIAFWYITFRTILKNINKINVIRKKINDIYNGNIENYLDEHDYSGELQQVVIELNDISGGLSNAIEQGIKSERLKTELITNVSHDIKTPLTSIINYVDLLKKENIKNEKVQEYLQILDNKSQRLKRLTEDLIEASKVSSGNVKLNIEKLNVKELIKQIRAEFEDKFKEKELEIVETIPKEDLHINADSKYMYRVLENMYINIAKYALEKSRVYIDIIKKENKIQIMLKNISKDKLNITEDELMQRFVRGEESRTTEGSGLRNINCKIINRIAERKI